MPDSQTKTELHTAKPTTQKLLRAHGLGHVFQIRGKLKGKDELQNPNFQLEWIHCLLKPRLQHKCLVPMKPITLQTRRARPLVEISVTSKIWHLLLFESRSVWTVITSPFHMSLSDRTTFIRLTQYLQKYTCNQWLKERCTKFHWPATSPSRVRR